MHVLFLLLSLSIADHSFAADKHAAGLDTDLVNPGYLNKPHWFKESFLDLQEDVEEAAEQGKRVMLYFHQDGCPYCAKLLQDNFADREIAQISQKRFDTISVNIWGDRSVVDLNGVETTEKKLASELKVQYTPTLLFLNERGEVVSRINGYFPPHKFKAVLQYVASKKESEMSLGTYLAKSKPIAASGILHRSEAFLEPPLKLLDTRTESYRPLVVFFEQEQCAACDALHGVALRRPEVAAALSNFDLALVDIRSGEKIQAPDGNVHKTSDWAHKLGIQYAPSLLFFDNQGTEVFRIEAYLQPFHLLSALDFVVTGAYRHQPSFQRFIQHRAEVMRGLDATVELMQ